MRAERNGSERSRVCAQLDERTAWDTIAIQNMLMRAKCLAELSSDEIAALGKPCSRTLPPPPALARCPCTVPSLPAFACRATAATPTYISIGSQPPPHQCTLHAAAVTALAYQRCVVAADAAMHRSYEPDETIFSKGDVGATAHRQRPLP
jgi:hypothetical protein